MSWSPEPAPATPPRRLFHSMWSFFGGFLTCVLVFAYLGLFHLLFHRDVGRYGMRAAAIVFLLGLLAMARGLFTEVVALAKERRVIGLAIELGFVALVIAGIVWAVRGYYGEPIPGDELLPLLGKQRDDPDVRTAFARLGWNNAGEGFNHVTWDSHHVTLEFDKNDKLARIVFGERYYRYANSLPLGLVHGAKPDDVRRLLGRPDGITRDSYENWHYHARGVVVSLDEFGGLIQVSVSAKS